MRIFLSYSHFDKQIADLIANRLKDAGHDIWQDALKIKAGENFAAKIQEGIESADAVIAVVSANSLASKWTMQEFSSLALNEISQRKILIIPILIDKSTVPSYLSNSFYMDISQDIEKGIHTLINSLKEIKKDKSIKISNVIEQNIDTKNISIAALSESLKSGKLTLVCGAGVSVGAGVPAWNQLLIRLLESMFEKLSKNHPIDLDSNAAQDFNTRYSTSSLILGKYLKNTLGNDFTKKVRDSLYQDKPTTCELIDAIISLSRPQRDSKALDSIITFNFDGLVEENLTKSSVPNRAIYSESIKYSTNELAVYHVHGYLPRSGKISEDTEIVFSEDAYHSQFIDPFSWSNLIQLNKFTQNTCLLIGVSLTDPNLRRLLDVSWRKTPDKKPNHYIIKKKPNFGKKPDVLDDLSRLLEEQDANALGINVIWVDNHDEVPQLVRSISN